MVRDEEAAPLGRDALRAPSHSTRKYSLVEEVEERLDLLLVDRVEAEVVDLLGAVPHAEPPPLPEVELGRQELARRVEHRRVRLGRERARGGRA